MAYIPRKKKLSSTQRGYGYQHQQQRERLLKKYPLCQICSQNWSVHLHHADSNPHNRTPSNVFMVCEPCHVEIHRPQA